MNNLYTLFLDRVERHAGRLAIEFRPRYRTVRWSLELRQAPGPRPAGSPGCGRVEVRFGAPTRLTEDFGFAAATRAIGDAIRSLLLQQP